MRLKCRSRLLRNTLFSARGASALAMTTKSQAGKSRPRKASRLNRRNRFLAHADFAARFEIASPRRGLSQVPTRPSTVKYASVERTGRAKTRSNSAERVRRRSRPNPAAAAAGRICGTGGRTCATGGYGTSRTRPFARRRFRICRPALVAMRARKPWLRLRLRLLGWKVLFMAGPRTGHGRPEKSPTRTRAKLYARRAGLSIPKTHPENANSGKFGLDGRHARAVH